jgi:hypothetical protein
LKPAAKWTINEVFRRARLPVGFPQE